MYFRLLSIYAVWEKGLRLLLTPVKINVSILFSLYIQ